MFYSTFFLLFFFVVAVLISAWSIRNNKKKTQIKIKEEQEEENIKYHQQKYRKIKEQYYRGIEIESKQNLLSQEYKIIGLEKPVGKWTNMVMKRNIQYISTLKNLMGTNFSKLGIWQIKVKAQSLISQAMHRGKGR
jgi:hypothetical protein